MRRLLWYKGLGFVFKPAMKLRAVHVAVNCVHSGPASNYKVTTVGRWAHKNRCVEIKGGIRNA